MTHTTFEIIVEAMLGGSASLDAERYSRALTDNFDNDLMAHHLRYVFNSGLDFLFASPSGYAVARFLHRDIRRIVESRRSIQSSQPYLQYLLLLARDHERRTNHERR